MSLRSQVRLAHGDAIVPGETRDISIRGIGVCVADDLARGAVVKVTLVPGLLASLPGEVRSSTADSDSIDGSPGLVRVGIRFLDLSEQMHKRLDVLLAPMSAAYGSPKGDPAVGPAWLTADALGRERLYQRAFACLEARDYRSARQHIGAALSGDPTNTPYRAFRHRVAAEEALSRRRLVEAARELHRAQELMPLDDDLAALRQRLEVVLQGGGLGGVISSWVRRLLA